MSLAQIIRRQFANPQGVLGHLAGLIMAGRPSNRIRIIWTVDLLGIGPEDRVLEIGCGPGVGLAAAAMRAVRGKVVGLDHSAVMLAQARRRNASAIAAGQVELLEGGLDRLGRLGGFDRIFSANVIQFLGDKPSAFGALFRALGPGGVIATTWMPRHAAATRADALRVAGEIQSAMIPAGFGDLIVHELPLKPVPAVCVIGRRPT